MGIHVQLDRATTRVVGDGRVGALRFADGTELACDMVVIVGRHPAQRRRRRALRPDRRARRSSSTTSCASTTTTDIYAVGECAQHRGQVYGLVAPLWEQAKVLADHLTGRNPHAAYHGSKLATKLKVMGVELATMGLVAPEHPDDEVVRFSEPRRGVYKSVIVRNGRLVGATLLGDIARSRS